MQKIIIFGTGISADNFIAMLDKNQVQIICFMDNNKDKHFQTHQGYPILPPASIVDQTFDYVLIATQYSIEVSEQLTALGVPLAKLIPVDCQLHAQVLQTKHEGIVRQFQQAGKKRTGKLKIALQNYNYSAYHGYALHKYMPDWIREKYIVDLLETHNIDELSTYDVICSSNYEGVYDDQHINVELWHGFPLKRLGFLHEEQGDDVFLNIHRKRAQHTDLVCSYSSLYTTFFNSGYPHLYKHYRITGMPRNDLLFEPGARAKLEAVGVNLTDDRHVLFYLPTWRKSKHQRIDAQRDWNSLFGFQNESQSVIYQMLEQQKATLVVKLHPYEYEKFKNHQMFEHPYICLLTDEQLLATQTHLYELLPAADLLITDYSSVAYDLLLIDTPLIFARADQSQYGEQRGFLVEPLDVMSPGKEVDSQQELIDEISQILRGSDSFAAQRKQLKSLVFAYHDQLASQRVWKEIDKYLANQ